MKERIFKVRIEVRKTYLSEIFVLAESGEEAMKYTESDREWEEDGGLEEVVESLDFVHKPVLATLLSRHDDARGDSLESIPWDDGYRGRKVKDYLDGKVTE